MSARTDYQALLAQMAALDDQCAALLPAVIAELPGQWDLLHQTQVGRLNNYGNSLPGQQRRVRDGIRTQQAMAARW